MKTAKEMHELSSENNKCLAEVEREIIKAANSGDYTVAFPIPSCKDKVETYFFVEDYLTTLGYAVDVDWTDEFKFRIDW